MKRTDMEVCCGKTSKCDIYRTVWESDGHYFVKWKGDVINVDKDIEDHHYITKNQWIF